MALRSKEHADEFCHLAAGAHYQRVRLVAFVLALFPRLVATFIKATAACHFEAAPFALGGMQTAYVLNDPSVLLLPSVLCFLHSIKAAIYARGRSEGRDADTVSTFVRMPVLYLKGVAILKI